MNLLDIYSKWEKKRDTQFLSFLDYNSDAIVVDLGCGDGEFSVRAIKQIGCKEMYGTEIWDDAIEKSSKKGLKVIKCDLNEKLPFDDGFFDVIISNQVLEHLWYPVQFIKEIKRILKDGGIAIISTENLGSWDNIGALIIGWTPFSMEFDVYGKLGNPLSPHNCEKFDKYPTHTRIFTYRGLISAFEIVGFDIVNIRGSGYIPFNFISGIDPRHCRFLTVKVRK